MTFGEAMNAAVNGAKIRMKDWDANVYWEYNKQRVGYGPPFSAVSPDISKYHIVGEWEILSEGPLKSRIREMAERAIPPPCGPCSWSTDTASGFGVDVIEAVATEVDKWSTSGALFKLVGTSIRLGEQIRIHFLVPRQSK